MSKKDKITVQGTEMTIVSERNADYISLMDMAKVKNPDENGVIANWTRNRNTIEYLGIWESLYNPNFKPLEFEGFKNEAGANAFTLSPRKWIESTSVIIRDYATCHFGTSSRTVEYGKHQCPAHSARTSAGGAAFTTQQRCDYANAFIDKQ